MSLLHIIGLFLLGIAIVLYWVLSSDEGGFHGDDTSVMSPGDRAEDDDYLGLSL